ncbi:MAG: FAD binding domain-containing protein [Spirochaetes bacterium]|nr:FAD binding domain-containing protein [Spirochaetota bacterium]
MSTIFEPKTITSLLNLMEKYPDSLMYSSGLEHILRCREKTVSIDKSIIYIGRIEDLKKMNRTERYIEIGAATRIDTIIDKGKNIIPPILLKAMKNITPPNFKNLLTIGGIICTRNQRTGIFSVLSILDAQLEIRSKSSTKWISINNLFSGNEISLASGEIITKIKLHFMDYDISIHREIDNDFLSEGPITFSAVMGLAKENINFVKFIFSTSDTFIIRNKKIESDLKGQNIPVNDKLAATIISQFSDHLDKKHSSIKTHRKNIIINTLKWFMKESYYDY